MREGKRHHTRHVTSSVFHPGSQKDNGMSQPLQRPNLTWPLGFSIRANVPSMVVPWRLQAGRRRSPVSQIRGSNGVGSSPLARRRAHSKPAGRQGQLGPGPPICCSLSPDQVGHDCQSPTEVLSLGVQVHISRDRIGETSGRHQPGPEEPNPSNPPPPPLSRPLACCGSKRQPSTTDGTQHRSRWHATLQMAHQCSRWHAATDGTPPRWHSPSARYHRRTCAPCTDPSGLNCNAQRSGDASELLAPDLKLLSSARNGQISFARDCLCLSCRLSTPPVQARCSVAVVRLSAVESVFALKRAVEVERHSPRKLDRANGDASRDQPAGPRGGHWRLGLPRPRQSWRLAIDVGDLPLKSPANRLGHRIFQPPRPLRKRTHARLQRHGYLFFFSSTRKCQKTCRSRSSRPVCHRIKN
ncbi:hypothetical protein B0T11DRAFT_143077 [Plectosphaerella cucumerina]|uniref:Uncharacterized protein n=1 Tax=Plectosphaerella cucumerina TaxID=40658 RepID=A0A8K0T8U2_9PEZI|nr:hypothetical protein B0T11DRAFT_143077 [Plectosphaerella cucumerina]